MCTDMKCNILQFKQFFSFLFYVHSNTVKRLTLISIRYQMFVERRCMPQERSDSIIFKSNLVVVLVTIIVFCYSYHHCYCNCHDLYRIKIKPNPDYRSDASCLNGGTSRYERTYSYSGVEKYVWRAHVREDLLLSDRSYKRVIVSLPYTSISTY